MIEKERLHKNTVYLFIREQLFNAKIFKRLYNTKLYFNKIQIMCVKC